MKARDIQVGQTYTCKISGKVQSVRITAERDFRSGNTYRTGYVGVNPASGREILIRSQQRLRRTLSPIPQAPKTGDFPMAVLTPINKASYDKARRHLIKNGWEHVSSRVVDEANPDDTQFGSEWRRAGETFWLNHKTLDLLPGKGRPADVTPPLMISEPDSFADHACPMPQPQPNPEPQPGDPDMAAKTAETKTKATFKSMEATLNAPLKAAKAKAAKEPSKPSPKPAEKPQEPELFDDEVCRAIAHSHFDKTRVRVPKVSGQAYAKVAKAFHSLGSRWSPKDRAHVFPSDARKLIEKALKEHKRPAQTGPDGTDRPAPLK